MSDERKTSTFVAFFYLSKRLFMVDPGAFKMSVHHVSNRDVAGLQVPPRAYAFMFFECEEDPRKTLSNGHLFYLLKNAKNISGVYFLSGKVLTPADVKVTTRAWKRVFRKMEAAGAEKVIMVVPPIAPGDDGYFQPFSAETDFTPAEVSAFRLGKNLPKKGD